MKIQNINPFYILGISLIEKHTRKAVLSLIKVIFSQFFWPQFHTHYFGKKRKSVLLNHPLDNDIPFETKHFGLYVSFFHLWIRSVGYIYHLAAKEFLEDLKQYLIGLKKLYGLSYTVYNQYQSTTTRPRYPLKPLPIIIRLSDPHLHCLPSLHVIVVFYNHYKMQGFLQKYGSLDAKMDAEINYAYEQALQITESVLLLKQHSLYCISASLFVLSATVPGYSQTSALETIDNLFGHLMVKYSKRKELCQAVKQQYQLFWIEYEIRNKDENSVSDILVQFLNPFYIKQQQNK